MCALDNDRRALLRAIAASGIATQLAGCVGGDDPLEDGIDGDDEDGDGLVVHDRWGHDDGTRLSFWGQPGATPDPDQQPDVELNAEAVRPIYEDWAERNPDYWIQPEYQTDLEQMQTELLQATARDDPPDLSEVDSFWIPNHWENLAPVNEAIEDEDDWFPFVREIVKPEDDWLAVWRNTDCRVLYYRVDLMDEYADGEPPETWDELVDVGLEIAEEEDMEGFMYNGARWEATTFDNLAYFWAQGGELIDDEGAPILHEDENYDALLSVFEWFEETIESGLTPERVVNVDDYVLLSQEALNGDVAMFLGGSWQMHSELIPEVGEDEIEDTWDVAPIPQREADTKATGTGGWTIGTFVEDGESREAAVDFAARFADPENMAHFCEVQGQLPTRPSVYEEYEFFEEDPYMQTFNELLEDGVARPGFPIYRTISAEWQIAAGRVIIGDESPADAVDIMIDNVQDEYES